MNYNHITKAYQNAERQALEEMNDPHLIVLTMLDALLKSMQLFEANIDIKNGGDIEVKSKHFARALTIIYALQSSLDFEKGGEIANSLFELYEYARQQLIADLTKSKCEGTPKALAALSEIREAWHAIGDQVKNEK
jgi:flagellar protein FliS